MKEYTERIYKKENISYDNRKMLLDYVYGLISVITWKGQVELYSCISLTLRVGSTAYKEWELSANLVFCELLGRMLQSCLDPLPSFHSGVSSQNGRANMPVAA